VHQVIQIAQIEAVMAAVLDGCSNAVADTDYRIVGTAAALLHGVHLPAADVDVLLRTRAGVDAFSAALSPQQYLSPPQYLDGSKQYFASFKVRGVKVEFSTVETKSGSATGECTGNGPWNHFAMVRCGRKHIPVVALELRLLTELARKRADRYVPIWQFMQSNGYDAELLVRGLTERGISRAEHIDLTVLTNPDLRSR
jgi:hypothetical protein